MEVGSVETDQPQIRKIALAKRHAELGAAIAALVKIKKRTPEQDAEMAELRGQLFENMSMMSTLPAGHPDQVNQGPRRKRQRTPLTRAEKTALSEQLLEARIPFFRHKAPRDWFAPEVIDELMDKTGTEKFEVMLEFLGCWAEIVDKRTPREAPNATADPSEPMESESDPGPTEPTPSIQAPAPPPAPQLPPPPPPPPIVAVAPVPQDPPPVDPSGRRRPRKGNPVRRLFGPTHNMPLSMSSSSESRPN
ncbi:unnamed protein product, partial [Mesorhabditis spiculigera]